MLLMLSLELNFLDDFDVVRVDVVKTVDPKMVERKIRVSIASG